MSDFGENIKQLDPLLTPTLNTLLYAVEGDTDHNLTLSKIKELFNIEDVEPWVAVPLAANSNGFINLADGTVYGAIKLEYIAKRGSRGYRTGSVVILVDDSSSDGATAADKRESYRVDNDDLGFTLDSGKLSSGTIQLKWITDNSDANATTLNYRILSKRPITVS
jgi:hypothetical protein